MSTTSILLGQRGVPDDVIRARLEAEPLLFLTNDTEFFEQSIHHPSHVVVSRVRQTLPIEERVAIWMRALRSFLEEAPPSGSVFELLETGEIIAWRNVSSPS